MPVEILMPQLGLTMTEGAISRWNKQLGDPVSRGEVILEVITDKISFEVEAAEDGFLVDLRVAVDEVVPVGTVIGVVGDHLEEPEPRKAVLSVPVAQAAPDLSELAGPPDIGEASNSRRSQSRVLASPKARRLAADRNLDLARVVGTGPEGLVRSKDLPAGAPASPHAPISPLAARVALDLGVPLEEVSGTGLNGKIMEDDVRRAAGLTFAVNTFSAPATPPPLQVKISPPEVKRRMASRMAQAKRDIPHFYESVVVDATAMSRRKALETSRLSGVGVRLTYTALLAEALVQALAGFPLLTARWENGAVVEDPHIHLGVAAAIEDALIVPVIHHANLLSLAGLASELQRLAAATVSQRFDPQDLEGGTFTLSNLGMYRIESFWPIINPPQCAILGVGAIEERLMVHSGAIRVAAALKMVLAADHRIVDGVYAARFLARLRDILEAERPGR